MYSDDQYGCFYFRVKLFEYLSLKPLQGKSDYGGGPH